MELFGDGLEERARFFVLHVEIAVAGDAEGGSVEDAVAAEHRVDVGFNEVFEEQEVALTLVLREGDERGEGARDGDDAEDLGAGAGLELALMAKKEREAESLVEDAREGMRGVERDGGEEWVDLLLKELDGELAVGLAEVLPLEDADAGFFEFGDEAVVPAIGLVEGEAVQVAADAVEALGAGEAAGVDALGEAEAFFKALEDPGDANLDELIQVAGGDGEEFYALEEGVGGVVGFFEDAAVELKPAFVAVDEATAGKGGGGFGGAAGRCRAGRCCGAGGRLFQCGFFRGSHASYETKPGLRGGMLIPRTTLIWQRLDAN